MIGTLKKNELFYEIGLDSPAVFSYKAALDALRRLTKTDAEAPVPR